MLRLDVSNHKIYVQDALINYKMKLPI